MQTLTTLKKALAAAFPRSLPILTGYGFLGLTYGIYMNVSGFPFWYPMCMALVIYGGSLEFVAVSLLLSPFAPVQTFIMALMIQARHLFYGLSMLDRLKGMGLKKFYLIYGLSDETFSITYTADIADDIDKGWFLFFVTLLDQSYWVLGATLGGICGSLIQFNTSGLEFVMTAMFVVIFLDQWLKEKKHYTALIGILSAIGCRLYFGADSFMVPTMLCILLFLTIFRRPIEKKGGFAA